MFLLIIKRKKSTVNSLVHMQHFLIAEHLYNKGNQRFNFICNDHGFLGSYSKEKKVKMYSSTLYIGIMDGHHKISISGVVFYVEESCRNLLMNHLTWIYRNNTSKENVTTIEASEERVAEILLDELKMGTDVINNVAVNHLIEKTTKKFKTT